MEFNSFISNLVLLNCLLLASVFITVKAFTNPEVEDESSFSYIVGAPDGPQNWGTLNPNWTLCGTGRSQSPINITTAVVQPSLGPLIRQYQPAAAIIKKRVHDIKVEWTGDAGGIIINGIEYKVKDCHWHIPSEHRINGERFAMELHIVHLNAQQDIAVVSILYYRGLIHDRFLRQIEPYLQSATQEGVSIGVVDPPRIEFRGREYYRYNGSLTVPPCSENVKWTVLREVRSVSPRQIQALKDAVNDVNNTGNARPIQPLNGRTVYMYRRSF